MTALLTLLVVFGGDPSASPPSRAPSAAVAAELDRLIGHEVHIAADGRSYEIRRVANEGKPIVGVVAQRGRELWLDTGTQRYRLVGPLAIPRIAGPRYKVWVLGEISGDLLRARRLGVLAKPTWPAVGRSAPSP